MEEEFTKKIDIVGQKNKLVMKNMINNHKREKEIKKRVVSEKWVLEAECYTCEHQLKVLEDIYNNIAKLNINTNTNTNENEINYEINYEINSATKIIIQEIRKKIYGYKQQDVLKKKLEIDKFLTFETVIQKLVETKLKCRYCDSEMFVLYDISREMKQWSVDRIDNDKGHNDDNFHLACLECNLKRRRRTDEKFLFTKKLNIVKQDCSQNEEKKEI
jgi:hypothetical protein